MLDSISRRSERWWRELKASERIVSKPGAIIEVRTYKLPRMYDMPQTHIHARICLTNRGVRRFEDEVNNALQANEAVDLYIERVGLFRVLVVAVVGPVEGGT